MNKRKIAIIIFSMILFVVLKNTLTMKAIISDVRREKINYYSKQADFTYDIELPQLNGNAEEVSKFNKKVYDIYTEMIQKIEHYEYKKNYINNMFEYSVIENDKSVLITVNFSYQGIKEEKSLNFEK